MAAPGSHARVLLIGAGPTAAYCSHLLRGASIDLSVWDKARGKGGRMSTSRATGTSGSCDLGAQYFTDASSKWSAIFADLVAAGTLAPFTGTIEGQQARQKSQRNYVAAEGVSKVVKHFFGEIIAHTRDGTSEQFDVVVLTLPVPQILQLQGDLPSWLSDCGLTPALDSVKYSSRYAVGLHFAASPATSATLHRLLPAAGRYVERTEDDVIRYISFDTVKRGIEADVDTLSIVVHTSVGFGHTHVNTDPAEVQSVVLERLQGLYPELPTPAEVKTQRWRYSQVTEAFSVPEGGEMKDVVVGRDSAAVMLLPWGKGGPAVVLAGDGFTTSNLEGCLESATAAVELVRSRL